VVRGREDGKICTRAHAAVCCSQNSCLLPGCTRSVCVSWSVTAHRGGSVLRAFFTLFVLEVSKCMAGSLSAGCRVHIRVSVSIVFR
jgi:hypothetical protein